MPDYSTGLASVSVGGGLGLDRRFRRVTGPMAVVHAVARRFVTPRGRLAWAPNDGFDIRLLLLETVRESDLPTYERLVAIEAEKDERVISADVTMSYSNETLTVQIDLRLANGPFRLVFKGDRSKLEVITSDIPVA